MRYIVQFRNGIWQVFDTVYYGAVRGRPLRAGAERDAKFLNEREPVGKRKGGVR